MKPVPSLSKESEPKLFVMPKRDPDPKIEMSPYEDVIDQVHDIHEQIQNIVIVAHLNDGQFKIFNALDPNIDLISFLEIVKQKHLQMINEYMETGSPSPMIA